MSFSITGHLKVIGDTQQISERFRKRDFVITENSSQYPQFITFQLTQDRCALLDDAITGTEVTVYFNLRGREWVPKDGSTPKYFNTIEAWKIEKKYTSSPPPARDESFTYDPNGQDDLPF